LNHQEISRTKRNYLTIILIVFETRRNCFEEILTKIWLLHIFVKKNICTTIISVYFSQGFTFVCSSILYSDIRYPLRHRFFSFFFQLYSTYIRLNNIMNINFNSHVDISNWLLFRII